MNGAQLDDGRMVLVSTGNTRMVGGKEFFLGNGYVEVFLDGGWQVVRKSRLKSASYGNPFEVRTDGT